MSRGMPSGLHHRAGAKRWGPDSVYHYFVVVLPLLFSKFTAYSDQKTYLLYYSYSVNFA
jgi:hypothetical protein